MYRDLRIAVVVPAYNEEKLIGKTVETMPLLVDHIIVVNDCSTDATQEMLLTLTKKHKRLSALKNDVNRGVGGTLKHGFEYALSETDADVIGVMAGDAQCDPSYISKMLDSLIDEHADYVKANRFVHLEALAQMPTFRRLGNIFITILTKFATGYYSIFDTQNGYGFFRRTTLEKISLDLIGERYDYENTLLTALSIVGAKVLDEPVPAIYGEEVSTIKFLPTAYRALRANFVGFWRRIYYKYIVFSFHPVALFLLAGLLLMTIGAIFGLYMIIEKIIHHLSPSSGTVMLAVLPIILGFQLLLTAFVLDVNNEGK